VRVRLGELVVQRALAPSLTLVAEVFSWL